MSNKASLMASLTGEQPEPEEDLFGEIPIDDEEPAPPPSVTPQPMPAPAEAPASADVGQLIVENPLDNNPLSMSMPVQLTQPEVPKAKSSLASSGLLGQANGGGGGGLFDEVDKEEEERQRLEDQRRLEEEKKRQEEEQLRQEHQRQEEERRRQAEEQMMQTVNLSSSVAAYPPQQMPQMTNQMNNTSMYTSYPPQQMPQMNPPQQMPQMNPPQQMPQMTNQMNNMSMSTAYPPQQMPQATNQMSMSMPAPMSFAERSQMMQQQSVVSQQYMQTPAPMYQQQPQRDTFSPAGFYRPDPTQMSPGQVPTTYVYSNAEAAGQTNTIAPTTPSAVSSASRLPQSPAPSYTVGMHNSIGRYVRPLQIVQPAPFEAIYGLATVSDPMLVQPPSLFNVVPPHWTYQVQTTLKEGGCWLVRRRFRHLVALEDRLHDECPGAILPPRPDKHATRAIEEASAMQSAEFAMQRAAEIQVFLNALVQHPFAGQASSLKLFLALQDDMGTAWPEVSSNALTRFGAVSGAAMQNVTETHMPWESGSQDALEDNAELLALANSEGIRMGAVTQAVPKLEGAITLLREHGESAGAVGMEFSKLIKAVEASDRDLGVPMEMLSQGLLKYGRRQKRLALELSAAMNPFVTQYKMCKYEKMAFHDRRAALQKRVKERGRADTRAQRLMIHQRGFRDNGALGELDRLERDASMSDGMAVGAVHHCDIIGDNLKSEVNRVAFERRTEWSKSMKVVCSSMREATAEQKSIWEATRESFLQAFPEYNASA